ncbi:MAG TPA: GTPase [Candidatus Saccharimonadales bacterium]|nr:GTPase [Candidatus Saccharimonadales bacterium]
MIGTAPADLRALVERLETLASRRLALPARSEAATARARQLADHLAGHVRVRARSLDAPLVVLLVGPTGAGKSTIFNTIAGHAASTTGVLRPTTRVAVVLVHPGDRASLLEGALAAVRPELLRFVEDEQIDRGLALIDAPDIDSVEHANRALADRLVEAADLCVFVTTATRYADQVPWAVLERVRERGLPLLVVVNRMPSDPADQVDVLDDVRRLLADAGLDALRTAEHDTAPTELVAVREGDLDAGGEQLIPSTIATLTAEIGRLRADREARIELATRALTGSLLGLGDSLDRIADDADHEAIDVEALRRLADRTYESSLVALRQEIAQGAFLREEALRHWQSFVGADQMTRFFSDGIGRIRGAIASVLRPATAPVAEMRAATTDDLVAVARLQAAEAARRTAGAWSDVPAMGPVIAADADLWLPSPDFDARLRDRLDGWIESIVTDIQLHGQSKRTLARGASVGVNVLGTGVMLGTFLHTGGLTGAEVGVAAATAFLNQKLLSALFGEAAMVELIADARARLQEALTTTFLEERSRFDRLLPEAGALSELAGDLRSAAGALRALPIVTG